MFSNWRFVTALCKICRLRPMMQQQQPWRPSCLTISKPIDPPPPVIRATSPFKILLWNMSFDIQLPVTRAPSPWTIIAFLTNAQILLLIIFFYENLIKAVSKLRARAISKMSDQIEIDVKVFWSRVDRLAKFLKVSNCNDRLFQKTPTARASYV
jgi:hypothetical protein